MKLIAVFKWVLLLLLLLAAAVGGGAFWLWQNSNQLIERQIVSGFDVCAPELSLHIGSSRLLSATTLQLRQVQIRDRETNRPLAHAAEVIVQVDETELIDRQRVCVQHVEAEGVDLILTRHENGRWNWQDYRYKSSAQESIVLPTVAVRDIRGLVTLEHGGGIPSARVLLAGSQFQAIPGSQDRYDFQGDLVLPEIGDLTLTGDWDRVGKVWKLEGHAKRIDIGKQLLDLATRTAPDVENRLQQLDEAFARILPPDAARQQTESTAIMIGTHRLIPSLAGLVDVDFHLSGKPGQDVPELLLKLELHEGRMSTPVIPDRFTDISATVYRDNQNVIVRLNSALSGKSRISGEFRMQTGPAAASPEAILRVERFAVDERLRSLFPARAQRFFDQFQPVGEISGETSLKRTADGRWVPVGLSAEVTSGTAEFHKFRYPVNGVSGTIRQRPFPDGQITADNVWLDVDLIGLAGSQPVTAVGFVRNPGPEVEMRFDVAINDLEIDRRFRDALDEAGQKVLDALDISGRGSAMARCYRQPGLDQPMDMLLTASVVDSKIRFRSFPYQIDDLSGTVEFDTRTKHWDFRQLRGRHGDAELTGAGSFRGMPAPGVLDLTVTARNGQLGSDLYNALGETQKKLWALLRPSGRVHLTTEIQWTALPNRPAVVRFPEVEIFDAEVFPQPFPYRMKIESARVSYDPNDPRFAGVQHCAIHSLRATHDGAPITASGWAEATSDNFWQLHLNDLTATDLAPNDDLRAALPDSWRETLGRVSHRGRVSIESSQLDFRGRTTGDAPPTAAWDMNLRLQNCGITAGLTLENVSGLVVARGTWDGSHLQNSGQIRLDTLDVLGLTLNRIAGPYTMNDTELLLGSRTVFEGPDPVRVPSAEQIRAEGYGGSLLLDGLIDLRPRRGYRLFGTINHARLEEYAKRHIPDQPNLKGIVNSWIYLKGEGETAQGIQGSGQLQISPAALYELPLMVKLLSALGQFNPSIQDRTAFDYALLTFDVRDQAFRFNPIDLVGDSLALRGQGSVGFGGDVVLDFYSRPAKPRSPSIPLVNALLFTGATQWVGVQVRGTINRPQTEVRSAIQLDESLRQFLSAFQPNPNGPIPSLNIPSIFSMPTSPQAQRTP